MVAALCRPSLGNGMNPSSRGAPRSSSSPATPFCTPCRREAWPSLCAFPTPCPRHCPCPCASSLSTSAGAAAAPSIEGQRSLETLLLLASSLPPPAPKGLIATGLARSFIASTWGAWGMLEVPRGRNDMLVDPFTAAEPRRCSDPVAPPPLLGEGMPLQLPGVAWGRWLARRCTSRARYADTTVSSGTGAAQAVPQRSWTSVPLPREWGAENLGEQAVGMGVGSGCGRSKTGWCNQFTATFSLERNAFCKVFAQRSAARLLQCMRCNQEQKKRKQAGRAPQIPAGLLVCTHACSVGYAGAM